MYRRIGSGQDGLFDVPTYLGFSLELGNVWQRRSDVSVDSALLNGAAFLGFDTLLGPVYVAAGFGEGGDRCSTCCSAASADVVSARRGRFLVDDGRLVAAARIGVAAAHVGEDLVPFALGREPVKLLPVAADEARERITRAQARADAVGPRGRGRGR